MHEPEDVLTYVEISGNVITFKYNEIISTNCDAFFVFISFLDEHFLLVLKKFLQPSITS